MKNHIKTPTAAAMRAALVISPDSVVTSDPKYDPILKEAFIRAIANIIDIELGLPNFIQAIQAWLKADNDRAELSHQETIIRAAEVTDRAYRAKLRVSECLVKLTAQ